MMTRSLRRLMNLADIGTMRLPGMTSDVWMGMVAAVFLVDMAYGCDSYWERGYCGLIGGTCISTTCCEINFRRLSEEEQLSFSAAEENPSQERQLQTSCAIIPPCPEGDAICDDPHMNGFSGQSLEWSGDDGGWYALIQDQEVQINVRLTAPLPQDFPNRQLVTGVSVLSGDGHSFVVEVNNPYSVPTTGCPDAINPCLANGALRVAVDDDELVQLLGPVVNAQLHDGLTRSTSNLPVECWQFGGSEIWSVVYEEMLAGKRDLAQESFEEWVLKFSDMNMAAPEWCTKYISERGLDDVQSTHAVFKIATPSVSVRVNVGVNHQGGGEQDWDGRILPDLDFWQMNVGIEGLVVGDSLSGILGETARPVLNDNGNPIMTGMEAIRGTVEDYRVAGALGIDFPLLQAKQEY